MIGTHWVGNVFGKETTEEIFSNPIKGRTARTGVDKHA